MKIPNRVALFSDIIAILKSDRFHRRNASFEEFRRVIFRKPPYIRHGYDESIYGHSNGVDDIDFDFNEAITCDRVIERFKYYKNIEYYDLGLRITHHKSVRNYDDKRRKYYKNARIVRHTDSGLVPKIQLPSYTTKANVEFEFESWEQPSMQLTNQYLTTYASHLPGGKHIYDKDNSSIYPSSIKTYNPAFTMQNLNKRRK
jgi:hypothetical protein